ncbi:alpha/beta-hydrolase [Xylariaceae sp. FL0804]|nr:alpha/beta-hydrolase [Xylariaceae sp. FL0804]
MATVDGIPASAPGLRSGTLVEEKQLPAGQKPKKAKDKTSGAPPSRRSLRMTAGWWRSLQCIGMSLHGLASPRPPSSNFSRTVTSTISGRKGDFAMQFWLPRGYYKKENNQTRWPAVVNFHGGGFTIGNASDDARFARFVTERANAVFISVDYRLAPEFPFPTAVEDGADALLYVIENAADLRVDPGRLATSGFSAGGNVAITAPMRLYLYSKTAPVPEHKILALATWYPITDYTRSREERRAESLRPEHTLPPTLTNLFDASYLFPPTLDLADPCLSPNKASDEFLMESIPPNVFFYTCEWDMLLREGEELARRFEQPPISRRVFYTQIPEVPHGWDKGPNPMKPPPKSEKLYTECCRRLRKVFDGEDPHLLLERPKRVPEIRVQPPSKREKPGEVGDSA